MLNILSLISLSQSVKTNPIQNKYSKNVFWITVDIFQSPLNMNDMWQETYWVLNKFC